MTGHSDRSKHGYEAPHSAPVFSRPPRVLTRAEVAGFAEMEAKANTLYGHGDQPSDWYWTNELAKLDASLAITGSAA